MGMLMVQPSHWIVLLLVLPLYMLPTIIAFRTRHPRRRLIGVVNLAAGWIPLVWIVAVAAVLCRRGRTHPTAA